MDYENENYQQNPEKNESPFAGTWDYQPQYTPRKPKKRGWTAGKVIALALCCSLLGGAVGGVLTAAFSRNSIPLTVPGDNTAVVQEGERENPKVEEIKVPTGEKMTAAQVYANNVNSTVGITTLITTNYWGYPTQSAASGSGFIITADGYILTNYHVVQDSSSVTVTTYDGTKYDAALVGYDESNDLAVLKIDALGLTPVILGKSSDMNVGDEVVAIGNPLGELTFSLTSGVVSALQREVTMSNGLTMKLIQTDCAINSGNSGGALFNLYGEVVGITNAKYSSSSSGTSVDNIGFAIPIDDVKNIFASIIEKGYISKPYIGVSVTDVSEDAQSLGLPQGAAVKSVVEGGPAAEAGLKVNDIITQFAGEPVTGRSDLVTKVAATAVGQEVTVTVYRQGETLEMTITVAERTVSAQTEEQPQQQQQQQQEQQDQQSGSFPFWFPFHFGY